MLNYQDSTAFAAVSANSISLQQLLDQLIRESSPGIAHNKTRLFNEVTEEFRIQTDKESVGSLVDELLQIVLMNAREGNIHITAQRFRETIILEIEDRNNYNGYALACRLKTLEPDALRMGGFISIKGQQQLVATVSFSFPDQSAFVN